MSFSSMRVRSSTVRRITFILVALAVSLLGFAAAPTAQAATSVTVYGTGAESSEQISLSAGTYQVKLTYSDNTGDHGATSFVARVEAEAGAVKRSLANDIATQSATRLVVIQVSRTTTLWVEVRVAAQEALWSVSFSPAPKLTAAPTPKVSGTAKVGRTLKAKPGTWKPSGVTLTYQWRRNGTSITGATKSSYKLTSRDKGKRITLTVTGAKAGYAPTAKTSKATAKVKK